MKAVLWLVLALFLFLAGATQAAPKQGQPAKSFPFTCTIDLSLLTDGDAARIRIPPGLRNRSLLTTGEKKCTFSNSPTSNIRCIRIVEDWPNAPEAQIKVRVSSANTSAMSAVSSR